jgi:hypothetical protein
VADAYMVMASRTALDSGGLSIYLQVSVLSWDGKTVGRLTFRLLRDN